MPKRILPTILALALAASSARLPAASAPEEVDVVVNKSNSTPSLSREETGRIFMGDKSSWPGGKRITVLMLAPGQPERAVILGSVFKMNESEYTKYFLQAAFTGRVLAPPRNLSSVAQMKAFLAANPSAIGYLKKEDVDDTVKVVLKLP